MKSKRINVLGVPVDCVDMQKAVACIEELLAGNEAKAVIAVNPEKVIKYWEDDSLRQAMDNAGLLIPDGIGVVFAAGLLGLGKMSRVPGSELMPELCQRAAEKGYKVFLFGAAPEINTRTADELKRRFPELKIVGRQHGYVETGAEEALITSINSSGADMLFIALGSPKQEQWMNSNLPRLKIKVCQGVGGTFDVICGNVNRAPSVFRKIHLEWLYRLLSQPKRILRQRAIPIFVWRVLKEKFFGSSR